MREELDSSQKELARVQREKAALAEELEERVSGVSVQDEVRRARRALEETLKVRDGCGRSARKWRASVRPTIRSAFLAVLTDGLAAQDKELEIEELEDQVAQLEQAKTRLEVTLNQARYGNSAAANGGCGADHRL